MDHPESEYQYNPLPQNAPGSAAAVGHRLENSIPLSIFPITADKFCICFCGLPGRGKTHIARRLGRYLSFFHAVPVEIYHVADYRRRLFGAMKDADWFDVVNEAAANARDECHILAINDMVDFLNLHSNGVAILDATNTTASRRKRVVDAVQSTGAKVMWIEVTNDNEEFHEDSCLQDAMSSPDYVGIDDVQAKLDYKRRIENYRSIFETIDSKTEYEARWSYIKCDHPKQHFVIHRVKGHLQQKIANFIMNLRTTAHSFFLSRHGQSEYNDLGRIGGDSGLTQHGINYAHRLAEFVEEKITKDEKGNDVPARLWTSTMRRTKETTQFIKQHKIRIQYDAGDEIDWIQMRPRAWHHLDELFAGSCDGMTYEEIEQRFPQEWERRNVDKLAYRYPRGESYLDVIARLEPIIIEMERHQENLLIVAHQGILRIIYAFYMGLSRADAPYVSIPLNCVVELNPSAYDCSEKRHFLYHPLEALSHDGQCEKSQKIRIDDPQSH